MAERMLRDIARASRESHNTSKLRCPKIRQRALDRWFNLQDYEHQAALLFYLGNALWPKGFLPAIFDGYTPSVARTTNLTRFKPLRHTPRVGDFIYYVKSDGDELLRVLDIEDETLDSVIMLSVQRYEIEGVAKVMLARKDVFNADLFYV